MFNFFNPPAPKPRLSQDKIPAKYAQMRLRVFLGAFLGYAAYYLVRKNLSLAAPGMIESGLLDKASVGLAGSAISIMPSASSSWAAFPTVPTHANSLS